LPPRVDPVAVTLIVPLTEAVVCAANVTLMGMFCPALSLIGNTSPGVLKLLPLRLTCVMVSAVLPEFSNATGLVCETPTATGPNVRLVGVAVRLTTLGVLAVVVSPLRLVRAAAPIRACVLRERGVAAKTALLKTTVIMMKSNFTTRFGRATRNLNL
jgi:hypothetical protein